jgi:indolepyruvate ferredoxin oxidoreductase beta subunit
MKKKHDFLFAGVGGQGTILASDILSEVGLRCGYDVKKSEVHGMSQRGGAVESHVRWGENVYSPLIEEGESDYFLAFEMLEGARWQHFLSSKTKAFINRHRVFPPAVNLGAAAYPSEAEVDKLLTDAGAKVAWVDGAAKATELGNLALAGVVMLGVLSAQLAEPTETWEEVIAQLVPSALVSLNIDAFRAGKAMA